MKTEYVKAIQARISTLVTDEYKLKYLTGILADDLMELRRLIDILNSTPMTNPDVREVMLTVADNLSRILIRYEKHTV